MDKSKKPLCSFARTIGNTGTRKMSGMILFLQFLEKYDGRTYDKELAYEMFIDMVMSCVYLPRSYFFSEYKKNREFNIYSKDEIVNKLNETFVVNNKDYKDLYDYANSRVKTFYVGLMNLALCRVLSNKPIEITKMGRSLLDCIKIKEMEEREFGGQSEENEKIYRAILLTIFCKLPQDAFSESHPNVRKMGNKKRIFPFLIGLLTQLETISNRETLIVSAWPNSDVRDCVSFIQNFRVNPYYGKSTLIEHLIEKFNLDKEVIYKNKNNTSKEDIEKNLIEVFKNQLIPFFCETGLININSDGSIYLNYNEISTINYIIDTYLFLDSYESYEEQFNDMQIIDKTFLNMSCNDFKKSDSIKNYAAIHTIDELKNKVLSEMRLPSKAGDSFELNVNLLLQKLCPSAVSRPNYTFDEKMEIRHHAPSGKSDFTMHSEEYALSCEVSLKSRDRDQIRDELESIIRHIEEVYRNNNGKAFGLFIAPKLGENYTMFIDSYNVFNSLRKNSTDVKILVLSLDELFKMIDLLSKKYKEVTIDILYDYSMKLIDEKVKLLSKQVYEKHLLNA